MASLLLLGFATFLTYFAVTLYLSFARNLAAAKQSGIPYIVVPVYAFSRFWLVTHLLFIPAIKFLLPTSWTSRWLHLLGSEWIWTLEYKPFADIRSDVFLVVSPGRNILYVASAEAICQITSRRNDFPKPIELYSTINLYGRNVITTEGSVWRTHRKITSPPFTEKNNELVFRESLYQTRAMLQKWTGAEGSEGRTVHSVAADVMTLSLHVISRAGFGVRLQWPHENALESDSLQGKSKESRSTLHGAHTLSFRDAISILLENIILAILVPHWLLARLPFRLSKSIDAAVMEWGKYMQNLVEAKKEEIKSGGQPDETDLLAVLVRGSLPESDTRNRSSDDRQKIQPRNGPRLSDEEVRGNMFVFIIAGHETTANVLHFAMIYLALNRHTQKRLQKDVDDMFGGKSSKDWNYERDAPRMFGSMVGAVMNETLRLIPPIVGIPKSTLKGSAQTMTLEGRKVIVPENTFINLNVPAIHRNPKYWPEELSEHGEPKTSTSVQDFRPERWLKDSCKSASSSTANPTTALNVEEEDFGGPQGSDTSSKLWSPPRAAYIPFSDGARACLGRRFAQVEIVVVLAAIFQEYSVELAVDDFASNEEVDLMPNGGPERKEIWQKAADNASNLLKNGMQTVITLQMRKGHVPLRFVKRGNETFAFD